MEGHFYPERFPRWREMTAGQPCHARLLQPMCRFAVLILDPNQSASVSGRMSRRMAGDRKDSDGCSTCARSQVLIGDWMMGRHFDGPAVAKVASRTAETAYPSPQTPSACVTAGAARPAVSRGPLPAAARRPAGPRRRRVSSC